MFYEEYFREDFNKNSEVVKKIKQINIFEISDGSVRKDFKGSAIIGAFFGIIILLNLLLKSEPGYTDIGFIIFFPLFFGFGITVLLFVILFFIHPSQKYICITLITSDKRVITLFTDIGQKEYAIEFFEKYFKEVKNEGFPYGEIDLN